MIKKILLMLIILIFVSCNVNAFGVATPFASGEDVVILPGESKELTFSIQNGAGATESVVAKIEILEGNDIVQIIDKGDFLVPANGEVPLKMRVSMPKYATKDDIRHVKFLVKATPPGKKDVVSMGYGVTISFNVVTTPPIKVETQNEKVVEEVGYSSFLFALIFVIIVGIVIYLLQKRNKVKTKKK